MTLAATVFCALPAFSQQHHPHQQGQPSHPATRGMPLSFATAKDQLHAQNHPECTCRAGGESFQLGAQICIGNQVVRCAMDLNVTSWKSVGSACPQS